MKTYKLQSKVSLLLYFLLLSIFIIAQENYIVANNTDSGNFPSLESKMNFTVNKTIKSFDTSEWGPWGPDDCFDGIDYRVKKGDFNSYSQKWYWYLQFRNRYDRKVYFSYSVGEQGTKSEPDHRNYMEAGSESDVPGFLLYSGSKIHVRVGYIRFGNDNSGAYATCDK